jgi:hypothetical protein
MDGSLTAVLVNRFTQGRSFVVAPCRAVQVHDQSPGLVHRQITSPVDDEFLGARVEIALTERRRIDRVEELSELRDADLYHLAALRQSVPSGRARLRWHHSSLDGSRRHLRTGAEQSVEPASRLSWDSLPIGERDFWYCIRSAFYAAVRWDRYRTGLAKIQLAIGPERQSIGLQIGSRGC